MKPSTLHLGLLAACSAMLAAPRVALADGDNAVVAVSSRASADYVRAQLPDGKFQEETFAFGKGGVWGGAAHDATIDAVDFMDVARTIAVPLAGQAYVPSRDPKATKILVMVYWGTTHTPGHSSNSIASQNLQIASAAAMAASHAQIIRTNPNDSCAPIQMVQSSATSYSIQTPAQVDLDNAMTGAMSAVAAEDRSRDLLDAQNASMLGYDALWDKADGYKGTPLEFRRRELVNELEDERYFVVLMAYDFQMMWKEKRPKLLWETRYSIRARGNDFSRALEAMTQDAAQYFGRNSGGLLRERLPDGHVDIGEQKVLAYGSQK
jgi:hypothetical protein